MVMEQLWDSVRPVTLLRISVIQTRDILSKGTLGLGPLGANGFRVNSAGTSFLRWSPRVRGTMARHQLARQRIGMQAFWHVSGQHIGMQASWHAAVC